METRLTTNQAYRTQENERNAQAMATRCTDLAYRIPEQIADTNQRRLACTDPAYRIPEQNTDTNRRRLAREQPLFYEMATKFDPICQDILGTEIELGKMICSCVARFHYNCLVQCTRRDPEYNPFLNNGIKCVTCNGIAAGIKRITSNRH